MKFILAFLSSLLLYPGGATTARRLIYRTYAKMDMIQFIHSFYFFFFQFIYCGFREKRKQRRRVCVCDVKEGRVSRLRKRAGYSAVDGLARIGIIGTLRTAAVFGVPSDEDERCMCYIGTRARTHKHAS